MDQPVDTLPPVLRMRPALAGLLGAAVACGTVAVGPSSAAQADEAPAVTVSGTASCDASTSHWVIQWSVQGNQPDPGQITAAAVYPAAGTLTGLARGSGTGTPQTGPVTGIQRLPDYGFTSVSLVVSAAWGSVRVNGHAQVALSGPCGPSIMPSAGFESQCAGWLKVNVTNPASGVATEVAVFSPAGPINHVTLQPGESGSLLVGPSASSEVLVRTWGQLITTGAWQQPGNCGPTEADRLKPGEYLIRGGGADRRITSPDGRFSLVFQTDGNLVLYEYGKRALWATGPMNADWIFMDPDGGPTLYHRDGTLAGWVGDGHHVPTTLVLQNDGNVVQYRDSDHKAVWASNTCCHAPAPPRPAAGAHQLNTGQALVLGDKITSPNGVYTLVLQDFDGNLVLYKNGTQALWAFGMRQDSWFINQPDGNLVAYKSEGGGAVWSSGTYGKGAGNLVLQDDGNLVLYRVSDHAVLWSTGTYGK